MQYPLRAMRLDLVQNEDRKCLEVDTLFVGIFPLYMHENSCDHFELIAVTDRRRFEGAE